MAYSNAGNLYKNENIQHLSVRASLQYLGVKEWGRNTLYWIGKNAEGFG